MKGSSMTVALETGNTTDGTVILTADATGKVMSGTYEVRSGDDTTSTPLAIKSSGLSLASGQNIWDIYGNKLNTPAIPPGQSLSDNENIKIDADPPEVTITGVSYDITAGTITISGTGFTEAEMGQVDVLEQLDWSKLRWNIDGDDVTANDVTFTEDDFSAAVLSGGEIVATLKSKASESDPDEKKEILENTPGAGFEDVAGDAATNAQDHIEISAGFIRDNGLNASDVTYDADATYTQGSGNPLPDIKINSIQSDTGTTPTLYGRYEADGSTPKTIAISATMNTEVIKGSAMTIKLNTGNSTLGTATLTADATGTVMSGTYTVREGDDASRLALSTGSEANAPIQLLTSSNQFIVDEYGNPIKGSNLVPPPGQSLADLSNITIDADPPEVTISGVSYDITAGTITISGTGFTEAEMGQVDVLEQLDWSKLRWNIDGDDVTANDVTFTKDDFSAAVLSGGEIVATLTQGAADKKKEELEGTPGLGFEDVAGDAATNAQDDIEISAGFIRDNGLNASDVTYDADATYTQGSGSPLPDIKINSIQSDTGTTPTLYGRYEADGSTPKTIAISATMNTEVIKGSAMTIKLNTGNSTLGTATLTADATGTVMSGTYTVREGDDASRLALSTGSEANAPIQLLTSSNQFIVDEYGNPIKGSNLVPPPGQSLADLSNITIDADPPEVTISGVSYDITAGTITISGTGFTEAEMGQVDVLEQLDWSKLRWNIDGDDVTANDVTFTKDDFSAAVLSGGEIVATLKSKASESDPDEKKEILENTPGAGFEDVAGDAATNAQDHIEISAGFIRDNGLNASDVTYDADATYTQGSGSPLPDIKINSIQSDTGTTPTLYGRYEADGSTPKTIAISATMNTEVIKGSAMTIKLNTGNSTLGTATLTADATGTVMSGTYTVREGDDASRLALSTGSEANAPIQLLTSSNQFIVDEYGNPIKGSNLVPPPGQSLADLSNITIDADPPEVTISGVSYDITAGTITISGTGFTEAEMGQVDVLEQLDWSKLRWNIDGDDVTANDVTFTKDDFSAAVLSGGEIVATLTQGAADKKKEELEGTPGLGFEDVAGDAATNAQDDIEISAGFIRDNGLNASDVTYDADATYTQGSGSPLPDIKINSIQSDAGATPVAFAHINPSTSSANVINISATMNTEVIAGSSMTIKLATNNAAGLGTATLTAGTTGTTMSGTYTVRDGDNVTALALNTTGTGSAAPIQLLTSSNQFIVDVFGTQIQGSDLVPPAGQRSCGYWNNQNRHIGT